MRLLPLLRQHVVAASSRHSLPTGVSIELMPIVEDGLFGFEFVPARHANTYVIVGCNAQGVPMLRKTVYDVDARNALQLVVVDGHTLSRPERKMLFKPQHRDLHFDDWPAAAEAAWAELEMLFPTRRGQSVALYQNRERSLEEALSIAHAHLSRWDPSIHFFGLPSEAEQGFALKGANGDHGVLVFQRPDIWMLRWKAPPDAVYESWSVVLPDVDGMLDSGFRDIAS